MTTYTHLSDTERETLSLELHQGKSLREIARGLGRHHSTLSRELRKYVTPTKKGGGEYRAVEAIAQAQKRKRQPRVKKLEKLKLVRYVIRELGKNQSPEAIVGRLRLLSPQLTLCYETIYQLIYAPVNHKLRLWEFLVRHHPRRQKQGGRKVRGAYGLTSRQFIDQRPTAAEERRVIGHWESDLMEGKRSEKEALSVTVDRKSRYTLLEKLCSKEADPRTQQLTDLLESLPPSQKRSVTIDNGVENTGHRQIQQQTHCPIYFTHPYCAWEKGTVENTIGVIRRYLPKGTSLKELSPADLRQLQEILNNRPRKVLGYRTPKEVFYSYP